MGENADLPKHRIIRREKSKWGPWEWFLLLPEGTGAVCLRPLHVWGFSPIRQVGRREGGDHGRSGWILGFR